MHLTYTVRVKWIYLGYAINRRYDYDKNNHRQKH